MLHRRVPTWVAVVAFALLAVFFAGFFRETASVEPARPDHAALEPAPATRPAESEDRAVYSLRADSIVKENLRSFRVPANLYRRAADFSCKVESVIDTYTAVDNDIKDFGGEITEMEITGNDDGRRGRISCTVSVDKFNPFVAYVRGKGKILSERVTASSMPRNGAGSWNSESPEPLNLSLVTIQVMDEKAAKEVEESRGMVAGSFLRGASHFLSGIAVIAEGLGWVAPYLLVLAVLFVSVAAVRRLRRRDLAAAPLGAQAIR